MTPQQQRNQRIWEWRGWKDLFYDGDYYGWRGIPPDGSWKPGELKPTCPNLSDRNVVAELVGRLDDKDKVRYVWILYTVLHPTKEYPEHDVDEIYLMVEASAEQRVEALGRVIG